MHGALIEPQLVTVMRQISLVHKAIPAVYQVYAEHIGYSSLSSPQRKLYIPLNSTETVRRSKKLFYYLKIEPFSHGHPSHYTHASHELVYIS